MKSCLLNSTIRVNFFAVWVRRKMSFMNCLKIIFIRGYTSVTCKTNKRIANNLWMCKMEVIEQSFIIFHMMVCISFWRIVICTIKKHEKKTDVINDCSLIGRIRWKYDKKGKLNLLEILAKLLDQFEIKKILGFIKSLLTSN